jgi:hypothetical protein
MTPLKQLEHVPEDWYKSLLDTAQNPYKPISRWTVTALKTKVILHHVNKEMSAVSVVLGINRFVDSVHNPEF